MDIHIFFAEWPKNTYIIIVIQLFRLAFIDGFGAKFLVDIGIMAA